MQSFEPSVFDCAVTTINYSEFRIKLKGRPTNARTVKQTCIERKASGNEGYQETSTSESTLTAWNPAASTRGSSFLQLVRKSLPGLLRIHVKRR